MLKSAIVLIAVSAVTMFFQTELSEALHYLVKLHDSIADGLAVVFSNAPAGRVIQETIALIIIPLAIGTVAGLIWLIIKRNEMPHLVTTVWIVWTLVVVAVLIEPHTSAANMNMNASANTKSGMHANTAATSTNGRAVHRTVYY